MALNKTIRSLGLAGASVCALSFFLPAGAQVEDRPEEQESVRSLNTVVVTARRREESLKDVPGSVTAIGGDALAAFNATEIGDVQSSIPNVVLHEGDAQNTVAYIRGVGQLDSLAFADPGVGIYLDDVYLGRAQGSFLDVFDVERIEVLRGPQGTLYGRNTIGGAIKFVSREPTTDPELRVSASIGSYEQTDLSVGVSGPIAGDRLLGKAAIAYLHRDGYADNSVDGESDGDRNTLAWRGSLLANFTDDFEFLLTVDGSSDTPDTSRTPVRETSVFGLFPPNEDPFEIDANFNGLNDLSVYGISGRATWSFADDWQLRSTTAYREMEYDANLDLDATGASLFGVFVFEEQNQFSQELQLTYDADSWSLVSGLYYFKEEDVTESGVFGPDIAFVSNSLNDQTTTAYAAYADASFDLSDRLSISAGIRFTEEEKDFARIQEFFSATTPMVPVLGQGARVTDIDVSETFSNTSPKFSISYDLTDDVTTYASYSRGFKSGGFDGRSNSGLEAQPFDAETLTAWEAGLKGDFLENTVSLSAAVFLNQYEDLQVSSFTQQNGAFAAIFTNAAEASIAGFEVEGSWQASSALRFDYALGYLDAEYDTFIGQNGQDVSDQLTPANAPDWTGRLAAEYSTQLSSSIDLILSGAASYRGDVYPTVSSSEVLRQSSYTLYDASARLEFENGKYALTLSGRNLSGEEYRTQGFDLSDSLGYQLGYYGAPRTFTLTASVVY
ncbi:TonB-dependent receptor [Ponticaulis koreensis]|uniref:TonB-dependent receptor n=1 Tax=Ponticaulis koreensis TaxID=1123045 RepID=UPI0003B6975E|nr:TonB-dependent receptor [Ponticaulis koreensis]